MFRLNQFYDRKIRAEEPVWYVVHCLSPFDRNFEPVYEYSRPARNDEYQEKFTRQPIQWTALYHEFCVDQAAHVTSILGWLSLSLAQKFTTVVFIRHSKVTFGSNLVFASILLYNRILF